MSSTQKNISQSSIKSNASLKRTKDKMPPFWFGKMDLQVVVKMAGNLKLRMELMELAV